jgi:hypothetical protein
VTARTLYLHVGTHKTGTTSVQAFLAMNQTALASAGVYVARTGRPWRRWGTHNIGNHNVAWNVGNLPNFRPDEGTFEELLAELAACSAPSAVVTSEDFEWLHDKPETFAKMTAQLLDIGFETTVLVHLRAQPEYIQALYTENAKAGFPVNFAAVLAGMIEHGAWVTKNPPVVTSLAYGPFLDGFARVVGSERVIAKPYIAGRRPSALLGEFLDLLGIRTLPLEALLAPALLNQTPTLFQVLTGLYGPIAQRTPAAPTPAELLAAVLAPGEQAAAHRKFDVMTDAETLRVFDRFADDNRDVAERYGASVPFQAKADLRARDSGTSGVVAWQRRLLEAAMQAWNITAASP